MLELEDIKHRIINARSEEKLKDFPPECVDMVITSPPYDDLRDYDGKLVWNFDVFKAIAKELYRVVKPGGVVVWIPTLDDGHAHITEHIMLGDRGVIDRLLTMSDCGDDFELISEPDSCPNAEKKECARCDCGESVRPAGEQDPVVIFKSSEDMSEIPAGSVKTIVTSPPYWNLKDYFKKGQIGQEDYATYLLRMEKVWSECFERLRPDGSLWVNINIRMHGGKLISIP